MIEIEMSEVEMNKIENQSVKKGCLYLVSTPLGNLGDITLRAIEVLKSVDLILAEDTRHSQRLLQHFGIYKPCLAFHEHNERTKTTAIVHELQTGKTIALISDAGTPLINDPGYYLVRELKILGYPVVPIPGPSALIAALSASGLPTDRFCFQGFLPNKKSARRAELESLVLESRTLIFFEAPHRVQATLEDLMEFFGGDREAVIARELTKTFETIRLATLSELLTWVREDHHQQKGEIVLLVHGRRTAAKRVTGNLSQDGMGEGEKEEWTEEGSDPAAHFIEGEALKILKILLAELPMAQAAHIAAKITGLPKRILYNKALELKNAN